MPWFTEVWSVCATSLASCQSSAGSTSRRSIVCVGQSQQNVKALCRLLGAIRSSNARVQRASCELVCNLMTCESGVIKFADGSKQGSVQDSCYGGIELRQHCQSSAGSTSRRSIVCVGQGLQWKTSFCLAMLGSNELPANSSVI
jgi:hypothetical protein